MLQQLLKEFENQDEVKIRMGMRPSGFPHLATANVINNCFLAAKELKEKGKVVSIDFTLDDLDMFWGREARLTPLKYHKVHPTSDLSMGDFFGEAIREYIVDVQTFFSEFFDVEFPFHVTNMSDLQKKEEFDIGAFELLLKLYIEQKKFSPNSLRKVLLFEEHQYKAMQDIRLFRDDLLLFGFANIFDWFLTLPVGALAPTTPAQGISSPVNPECSRHKELVGEAFWFA